MVSSRGQEEQTCRLYTRLRHEMVTAFDLNHYRPGTGRASVSEVKN